LPSNPATGGQARLIGSSIPTDGCPYWLTLKAGHAAIAMLSFVTGTAVGRSEEPMRFFARLEKLFEEGLGPWIALIGAGFMILAWIYLTRA
jgi:hypothetical protein